MAAREELIDRLRKIKNSAEGEAAVGNEAAAQNIAGILQRMLLKHRISEAELAVAQDKPDEPIVEHKVNWEAWGHRNLRKRIRWTEQLAGAVARVNGCRELISPGTNLIFFVGRESSVLVCAQMLGTLAACCEKVSKAEYFKHYHKLKREGNQHRASGWRQGWIQGFVARIIARLNEAMQDTPVANLDAPVGTGEHPDLKMTREQEETAMVLVRKDREAVDRWMSGKYRKIKSRVSGHYGSATGRLAGSDYADNVDLQGAPTSGHLPGGE